MQDKRKVAAIILAAGKGTRMQSTTENKVTLPFHGKPIIKYAVEVVETVADQIVVVVGAMAESVQKALDSSSVIFAHQAEQLGTGHALQVGFGALANPLPECVLVGYGDHMMFYRSERLQELVRFHEKEGAAISLLTATYNDPNSLAWARVLRNERDEVVGLVEQKDATEEQRSITEVNPGLYCMSYDFLQQHLPLLTKSPVTNEYYLTELLEIAAKDRLKIAALTVPFQEVGIGINRPEELEQSQELFTKSKSS